MQPRNVYDYTDVGSSVSAQSTILRKTYGLLGLSFLPAAAGAFVAMATIGLPWAFSSPSSTA